MIMKTSTKQAPGIEHQFSIMIVAAYEQPLFTAKEHVTQEAYSLVK